MPNIRSKAQDGITRGDKANDNESDNEISRVTIPQTLSWVSLARTIRRVVSSIFFTFHFSTFFPLFSDSSSFISLVFFFSHLNPQFSCLVSLCSFHFTYFHIFTFLHFHIFTYSHFPAFFLKMFF